MTIQIVITRRTNGTVRIIEMGYGQDGRGETLREHDLQSEISDAMAARYLSTLITSLQPPETE